MFTVPLALALALSACAPDPVDLTVDIVSDWTPGLDFTAAKVELSSTAFDAAVRGEVQEETLAVTGTEDFLGGVRVAGLRGVGGGRRYVRVSLRSASGATIASRIIDLTLEGSFAVVAVLARSCESVPCPAPAGSPALSQCQAGVCVDPRCSPSTPEYCEVTPCGDDAECPASIAWCEGEAVCRVGACLCDDAPAPTDAGPTDAGPADTGPADTGPTCPTTETACTDGVDDDCDGMTDCADPDCRGASCNDGFYCTTNDRCGGDGACSDTSPTCPTFCNESSASCEECMSAGDCGTVTRGPWSACTGFADACDPTGTRSRSVMTPTCTSGACRVTSSTETEGCSRTVANGTGCGPNPWQACCGGTCIDTRFNNDHCGSCDVSCTAIGGTCAEIVGRGYACTCGASLTCQGELNGDATCYNTDGQSLCNCQCPGLVGGVVCPNAGCGAGFYCWDCLGHNTCAPFGGSC